MYISLNIQVCGNATGTHFKIKKSKAVIYIKCSPILDFQKQIFGHKELQTEGYSSTYSYITITITITLLKTHSNTITITVTLLKTHNNTEQLTHPPAAMALIYTQYLAWCGQRRYS